MTYSLILMGWDANNRLYDPSAPTIDPADPTYAPNVGVLQANVVGCRNCSQAKRIIVSSTTSGAYAAGANELTADTEEMYVLQFAARSDGLSWMLTNRDKLVGKRIYSVDSTLGP